MLVVSGIPKTIVRLDDLLGLTELQKAVILMVMVYYNERMQIRMEKMHMVEV